MTIEIVKTVLKKIIIGIVSIFLYLPVICGILAPMLLIIGINFYISWKLIGYSYVNWTWAYYLINPSLIPIIISIEILIFSFGLGLFLTGLITMVKKKIEGETIIQTGIYKYIRHPQNLGIIFMTLPFVLYIPGFRDLGIRMGEIASWIFFTFLLCLYSYYEEWRLVRKYKEVYLVYYKKTGFFIPKFLHNENESLIKINFSKKIIIVAVIFLTFFITFFITIQLFMNELMIYRIN